MFLYRTVEIAFQRFQTRREPRALAVVFDRTAPELLALARHLAPPGTEAEDLVQATFVTAIEAAGSHRPGERVLPWLCGILANHARAARRRGRRVVDPTRLPHAVADAGLDAESSELRAELRAAIDRLPEVYRPVLRLVFEHGLQAQEVAHALERPAGTVRAQVTRGLDLLRRTLPASLAGSVAVAVAAGRGLAAVRQSVLAKAGGTGLAAVSPLFVGGLIVLHHKLVVAAAAACLAVLGLFWFSPEPLQRAPDPMLRSGAAAVAQAPLEPRPPEPERRAVAEAPSAPAPLDVAPPSVPATAAMGGEVVVRVLDTKHDPVPGIRVALYPFAQMQDFGRRMDYFATDTRGEVRFGALANDDWAIDVDRIGMNGVIRSRAGTTVEREVTLTAGVRVLGRVVDRRGAPVPGADLVLHGSRATATTVAIADAQGAFSIEHLVSGIELQARTTGRVASLAHAVRAGAGGTVAMELVLGDAARTVRGRVLDPDGRPVADAVVAILPASARAMSMPDPAVPQLRANWLRTSADGTFACDEVGTGPQIVFARALPLAPAWIDVDTTHGEAVADIRLPHGSTLVGTVRRGGAAVAGVNVVLWPTDEAPIGYLQNLFGMRHAATDAHGSYRIDGIVPGAQSVRLMQEMNTLRQETLDLPPDQAFTWTVDLTASATLRIAVQSPVSLAHLRVVAIVCRSELRDGDVPSILPLQADGSCRFTAARDGPVDIELCHMPGGSSLVKFAAMRSVLPNQHEVTITVRDGDVPRRAITGRLVDAQQAPIAGSTIAASKNDANGLFVRLEATTAADGTFTVGPLPAGDYTLVDGPMQSPRAIGRAVLTGDRDEPVGDLVTARR